MKKFFRQTRQTCDAVIDFCRRNVAGQTNCSAAFKAARRTLTALLIVAGVLTASLVGATIKLYTATAEDYASEVESQDVAKLRARDKAIKKATKEAGVYLKTYSRSVNNELTDDEVTAITSNSWQLVGEPKFTRTIKQVSDETSIIVWTATVEVNVDDSELQSWLNRDDNDKSTIIDQTRVAQTASEENERTIEDLRERYNQAASQTERDEVRQQIDEADRDFLALQKIDEGNKLSYAKDYNGAIRLYGEAVELKPDWHWAYNNRGIAYDDLKQYERAIADYNKALQLNPNYDKAYNNRGLAYLQLNQNDAALADFNRAIELNPNFAFAYNNRGVANFNLQQYERAIQDYSKAIQLDPNYATAYNNRANSFIFTKQFERAFADYDKALKVNPNYAEAYYNRGYLFDELGQYDRAIADYSAAIKIDPNHAMAYNNRGVAYHMQENYKQAIADYTKALQLNPNLAQAYYNRGLCYESLGDNAKAQADFAKAKQLGFNG